MLLYAYILNIHRPPLWVIRSLWGNCKCLPMSGIRQPFFVWCSYRSLSTRGSWWGSVPLRSVFNYFFVCGTVQKDNSKPHTHLRLSPCAVRPAFGCREEHTNDYILATLSLPPPIGMGVDRELKPRLSVAELRGLWIENSISFPGLILEAHSAECHYSLFFSSSAKMLSTYLTTRSYSLPLFSLSA